VAGPRAGAALADPEPLRVLADVVPGLDAVRVLGALRFGVYLVIALLAAYGTLLLIERLRARARYASRPVLSLLVLAEAFDPTKLLIPRSAELAAYRVYPSVLVVDLVKDLPTARCSICRSASRPSAS